MTPRPDRLLPFARPDYAAASAFSAKSLWRRYDPRPRRLRPLTQRPA